MTSEDSDDLEAVDAPTASGPTGEQREVDHRSARPIVAGAVGLLAGVAGGIVGTTIAPENVFLTVLLVVVVALAVTLGVLHVLSRRGPVTEA